MKNQYFADVGDYGKYGLLRFLSQRGICIAVNWYLTEDDAPGSTDGNIIDYLQRDDKKKDFRVCDPQLYDVLREMRTAKPPIKDVVQFEKKDMIPGAIYYHNKLDMRRRSSAAEKRLHRAEWHRAAFDACREAELVFLDPDNGLLAYDGSQAKQLRQADKYAYTKEVEDYYNNNQDVVYYCHRGRRTDSQWEEYKQMMKKECPEAVLSGITFHRGTQRSFIFVCHPEQAQRYITVLQDFLVSPWGQHKHFTQESL